MVLADELKNLVGEIKAGKAERRQRLGEIKREITGDLSSFASARRKMAGDLRESLAANTRTTKEKVSVLMGGFRAEQKQLKEEVRAAKKVWKGVPEVSSKPRKETYPKR